MKFNSLLTGVAVFLTFSSSWASKMVCDGMEGRTHVQIEIKESPFTIKVLRENGDTVPLWDAAHRCGTLVSKEDLNTTKCNLVNSSDSEFFGLNFYCYVKGDSSRPY